MADRPTIALIGFSEVGQAFAAGLGAAGAKVRACDLQANDTDLQAVAASLAVPLTVATADVGPEADIVVSAVTAAAAQAVADDAAAWLSPGQIFLDVNSTGPADKQAGAAAIAPTGAHYVEGAIMSPVAPHGHRVPMLLAGPKARAVADVLTSLEMNVTVAGETYGAASAAKMCRSIVMKGIEAIVVESMLTARAWDVDELVLDSLAETYPGIQWRERAGYLFTRVMGHGRRRAEELRQAATVVRASGYEATMASAIAKLQDWAADRVGGKSPTASDDYRDLADTLAKLATTDG
jgi:3-hydroxyisobutyrate dehydrogenase-like beta-hydroxyacid dehydrogenase